MPRRESGFAEGRGCRRSRGIAAPRLASISVWGRCPTARFAPQWVSETSRLSALFREGFRWLSPWSRHRGSAARLDFLLGSADPQLRFAAQWVAETSRLPALFREGFRWLSPLSRHRGSAARLDFLLGSTDPQLRFAAQWVAETSRLSALFREGFRWQSAGWEAPRLGRSFANN